MKFLNLFKQKIPNDLTSKKISYIMDKEEYEERKTAIQKLTGSTANIDRLLKDSEGISISSLLMHFSQTPYSDNIETVPKFKINDIFTIDKYPDTKFKIYEIKIFNKFRLSWHRFNIQYIAMNINDISEIKYFHDENENNMLLVKE